MAQPKPKKQKLGQNPFGCALDETVLTTEEREDLENNYVISCRTYSRLEVFGSSDSDSSPVYTERSEHNEKRNHQIQFKLKKKNKNDLKDIQLTTIGQLASFGPPSSWNKEMALDTYTIFKVSTYIIDPNYLFCVSLNGGEDVSYLRGTMESLLREIGVPRLSDDLPKWNSLKDKLVSFLDVYDGCEELPDLLIRPATQGKAITLLRKFITNLDMHAGVAGPSSARVMSKDADPQHKRALEMVKELRIFARDLLIHLNDHEGGGSEKYVQWYITTLLNYFFSGLQLTHSTPIILGKQRSSLKLPLPSGHSRDIISLPVEPDLIIRLRNRCFLVGEIKGYGCHGRDEWTERHRGHRVKVGQPPGKFEGQPMESTERLSQEEVMHLKMKYRSAMETNSSVDPNVEKKPHVDAIEGSSGDAVGKSQHKAECKGCGYNSHGNAFPFQPFRDLDVVEEYKVSSFLPQLLAGMFACMGDDELKLGTLNENVRFGFSVVGFKLRFVRLVICTGWSDSALHRKPTIMDITDQRVRCEVFLTQEINLFKKKHIRMLFQLLFGLTYVNHY